MKRAAVFLDRDDTINVNAELPAGAWEGVKEGDLLKPEYAVLMDGVREALVALKNAGYVLVVITNQGGLARGGGTTRCVEAVNDALREKINGKGCGVYGEQLIEGWYFAPHHAEGCVEPYDCDHPWRKPHGGMIRAACEELGLDASTSWMIGDKQRDLDAGMDAGVPEAHTIQIGGGCAHADLMAAAEEILTEPAGSGSEVDAHPEIEPGTRVKLESTDAGFVPMADERTREMVEAVARGIAERTGIEIHELAIDSKHIEVVIGVHRLGALAFMAQLRRDTNRWHERNFGTALWSVGRDW
ncbi:MAG: HAD-IIIA family hydrolase [Phycisphaerales bacterium]|nr:HAD-IIIA family hydrolase [Phycisphaerales bacterium]